MKKKLVLLVSALCGLMAFSACNFLTPPGASSESGQIPPNDQSAIAQTYTVTFKQDGQTDVKREVKQGETLTDFPDPVGKVGYTVVWDTAVDLTNITEDLIVRAIETPKTYTVTYDVDGGTPLTEGTQDVTYDAPTTLATPTREGYTFSGWAYEKDEVMVAVISGDEWKIAKDVTLVAQWTKVIVKYTVTFEQDGYEPIEVKVNEGEGVAEDSIPQTQGKTGYTVVWDKTVDLTNITENIIVKAVATANTYTITYDANGGTVTPATQEVTYDAATTLATPTRDDYAFASWTYEGNAVASGNAWTIDKDATLVAQWTALYSVTFIQNGETVKMFEVEEGAMFDKTKSPAVTQKTGYDVDWDADALAELDAPITSAVTIYAIETPKTYTITYDANGGTVTPATQKVTYDAVLETLATPTFEGYTFTSWTYEQDDGTRVSVVAGHAWTIPKDVTLVANWTKVITYYTVTFKQANQPDQKYPSIEEGTKFTDIPKVVAVTGYEVAWKEADLAKLDSVTENVIVEATIEAKKYNVTLNANGGTVGGVDSTSTLMEYDATYELATPTRTGYTFKGWQYNGETIDLQGTWNIDAESIELTAVWEQESDEENWTQNY